MGVQQVTTTAKLLEARKTIGHVYIDPKIKDYIVQNRHGDASSGARRPRRT